MDRIKLAQMIQIYRAVQGITVRDLAREIKLTPSTLNRFENGKECGGETLSKILKWLLS